MRHLKTSEAASLLNVSPNTLRAWEQRFGFPKPQRSPGKHRMFTYGEIAALRDALQDGLSISSAISRAQEGIGADSSAMLSALLSFDSERADAAIAAALTLRSVEHTVHQVLLPALDEIAREHNPDAAVLAGGSLDDDDVARWAYAVKLGAGSPQVFVYRRGNQRARRPAGANALPVDPVAAGRRVLELVEYAISGKNRPDPSPAERERGRLAVAS